MRRYLFVVARCCVRVFAVDCVLLFYGDDGVLVIVVTRCCLLFVG